MGLHLALVLTMLLAVAAANQCPVGLSGDHCQSTCDARNTTELGCLNYELSGVYTLVCIGLSVSDIPCDVLPNTVTL
jgi:hypothetical protein